MSNKDLEALYEKVFLKENQEILDPVGFNQSGQIHGTEEKDRDDKEFDTLNGDEDVDPLEETEDEAPKKALKELVAAVEHLCTRHQNVIDGAKTERSFLKEVEQLMPIIRSILGKISL
jgi:DNA-directed RNA polymerase specialized sigma subunit